VTEKIAGLSRRQYLAALLLATSVSTGCIYVQRYPGAWPPRSDERLDDDCPVVSGAYEAHALDVELANLLLTPYAIHAPEGFAMSSRVDILQTRDVIDVVFWRGQERLGSASLSRGTDYECSAGRMNLRAVWGSDSTDFGPSYGRGSVSLTRAADGSLTARRTAIGIAFPFPPLAIVSFWHRFEPITTD
jgi:hypothetical protein